MEMTFINESNISPVSNVNVLPYFATFNDAFTWNVVSGSATAVSVNDGQFEGSGCFKITGKNAVINSGGSYMQYTVPTTGTYILSTKHNGYYPSGATQTITVTVYVNEVATPYYIRGSYTHNGVYRTYYQTLELNEGDVIDFDFEVTSSDVGTLFKNFIDCFKLELDSLSTGTPSIYQSESKIPPLPTDNGSYNLKVLDGVYSWELIV